MFTYDEAKKYLAENSGRQNLTAKEVGRLKEALKVASGGRLGPIQPITGD